MDRKCTDWEVVSFLKDCHHYSIGHIGSKLLKCNSHNLGEYKRYNLDFKLVHLNNLCDYYGLDLEGYLRLKHYVGKLINEGRVVFLN